MCRVRDEPKVREMKMKMKMKMKEGRSWRRVVVVWPSSPAMIKVNLLVVLLLNSVILKTVKTTTVMIKTRPLLGPRLKRRKVRTRVLRVKLL